jgi:hypothetical protein
MWQMGGKIDVPFIDPGARTAAWAATLMTRGAGKVC